MCEGCAEWMCEGCEGDSVSCPVLSQGVCTRGGPYHDNPLRPLRRMMWFSDFIETFDLIALSKRGACLCGWYHSLPYSSGLR